eukprot:m51a1_g684 hypothetical protein (281) ;mRNA; f:318972-320067
MADELKKTEKQQWGLFETEFQRSRGLTREQLRGALDAGLTERDIDRYLKEGRPLPQANPVNSGATVTTVVHHHRPLGQRPEPGETPGEDTIIAEYGRVVKVLVVGDSGAGKTALYNAFAFPSGATGSGTSTALGSAQDTQVVLVTAKHPGQSRESKKRVKVKLWDSSTPAGRSRSNYRSADAVVVLYSTSSRPSFDSVQRWVAETKESSTPRAGPRKSAPSLALVGNVAPGQRAVSDSEGADAAKRMGFDEFAEVDARNASAVTALVARVVARAFETDRS